MSSSLEKSKTYDVLIYLFTIEDVSDTEHIDYLIECKFEYPAGINCH